MIKNILLKYCPSLQRNFEEHMKLKHVLLGFVFAFNTATAFELCNEIDFITGWRTDKVQTSLNRFNEKGCEIFQTEHVHAPDLDSWQFGFRGVFAIPSWWDNCYCDGYVDPNNLYLRGSALWGWGTGGDFRQIFHVCDPERRCAKTRNVTTQDYDVALGWFIPLGCYFGAAPVVGYNYDEVTFKVRHFRRPFLDGNGTKITSKFAGPYVGADVAFTWCDWLLAGGYEYHWVTRWRSNWETPGDFLDTFNYITNYKRAHSGWGNVAHADLIYSWCNWDIGINFKYRYFTAKHGRNKIPAFTEVAGNSLCAPTYSKTSGKWWNYEVNLVLGTRF